MASLHGGQIIARALRAEGVDTVFTLTGGHILPILDGCILEGIRVVDVRHEQSAAHAAEAYTRLTGKLGVAVVTAGPGVTDTVTGVASAYYAAVPMLVIGGRHYIRQELRGGLQEMDHPRLFHSITGWAATAWQTDRLADYVATAARHAFTGRGRPVFLDVPLEVLAETIPEESLDFGTRYRTGNPAGAAIEQLQQATQLLASSARPVVFAGGGLRPAAAGSLVPFVEALQAPVYLNGAARGALPHGHPLLGKRSRKAAFAGADLVLALGVDWDFRTGYGKAIGADATVIQVDADATKIGWNRPVDLGIVSDPARFLELAVSEAEAFTPATSPAWTSEIMAAEAAANAAAAEAAASDDTPIHPERFAREVAAFFGPDAIVAVDGGDVVSTTASWLQVSHAGHVLDPGPFGTLGTGAPFALAAKVLFPDKLVGIVYGDGGFGFNGMEFDTFVRLGLPVIGVVGNNGVWGNIKTIHRTMFPDRLVASDLGIRPYHAMVEALGGYGEFVDEPDKIRPALERAAASGLPSLINVHVAEVMRLGSIYSM
jgi:acetolactate synthase-1/2/3 large subunit